MKKVIVIGCPGSGKSTFARALHEKTGLPLVHLDMLFWNADRTTVEKTVFLQKLEDAMAGERWIIDGNYSSTMEKRLAVCDTVFFLDYPAEVCLNGVRSRRGTVRSDLPWIETEEDEEFMELIRNYGRNSRPQVMDLLEKNTDKTVIRFTDRMEAEAYIKSFGEEQ